MKIVLLEPLGISADKLKALGDAMTAQGHEFVSYDTLAKDEAEQIKRIDGADVVIIANHPLPALEMRMPRRLQASTSTWSMPTKATEIIFRFGSESMTAPGSG